MEDSVSKFLQRYGAALSAGDASAITTCWAVPSLVLADHGAIAVTETGQVAAFFTKAVAEYRAESLVSTTPQLERHEQLSETLAGVYVRWSATDSAGAERSVERSYYVLQRDEDGGWHIRVALTLPGSGGEALS